MTTQSIFPVGGIAGAWRGELRETSRLGSLVANLEYRWARYKTFRRTIEELRSLNDRELDDIGIGRRDIRRIATDAAFKAYPARA